MNDVQQPARESKHCYQDTRVSSGSTQPGMNCVFDSLSEGLCNPADSRISDKIPSSSSV